MSIPPRPQPGLWVGVLLDLCFRFGDNGAMSDESDKTPDFNNVYSTISSPVNLELAVELLKEQFPDANVGIKTSGYNGAKTLQVASEQADFEGYATSDDINPDYFFNGGLAGDDLQVAAKVRALFQSFQNAGFRISIEAYDSANELICDLPGNKSEPTDIPEGK